MSDLNDLETLAAEYALGTLDLIDRRRAEDLLRRNPGFARLVHEWEGRLVPLAETIQPVEPPADVWRRIEYEIGLATPPWQAARPVAAPAAPAPSPSWLESLAFWRWSTFGAGALAAACAAYIAVTSALAPPPLANRYVAVLGAGEAQPALVVTIDPGSSHMTIRPLEPATTPNQAYELWLVAGDEQPQSLGLLDPSAATTLDVAPSLEPEMRPAAGLAVSLEPPGGSPTGLPTGPVVYHGPILPLED